MNLSFKRLNDQGIMSRRKFSYLLDDAPMVYNYNQHNVSYLPSIIQDHCDSEAVIESQAAYSKLSYNPFEKMEQSLISGK